MPASRTQIVSTIGPASKDPAVLDALISHGMDVARLNFSHGTYEEHAQYIADIRAAAKRADKHVPIIQDLSGPRVKTETGHTIAAGATQVITEKDLRDLEFGVAQGVDYVVLSYVGAASDMEELREHIASFVAKEGAGTGPRTMAKIERQEALDNIHDIVAASDSVMLGRGDLGQAIPMERLPFVEAHVVRICKEFKKPVIVATEMLKSMVENPTPTRAEVTDVAYAVILGADAVMLSEETAIGKHPVETVSFMERIVTEAERYEREVNQL
ncbi:MAG TPA: pyruvate kinase [Candidatus Paceibacterota bacterium]|nr:pyruvate kinase [Candidatus Paceibacterota bacterium]